MAIAAIPSPSGSCRFSGRFFASTPTRGRLSWCFKFPGDNSTDYIKRLIGLPGDRIQMKDGVLYINDKAVPKVHVDDYVEDFGGHAPSRAAISRKRFPMARATTCWIVIHRGDLDNTQVFRGARGPLFHDGRTIATIPPTAAPTWAMFPFENFVGKAGNHLFLHQWQRAFLGSLELGRSPSATAGLGKVVY